MTGVCQLCKADNEFQVRTEHVNVLNLDISTVGIVELRAIEGLLDGMRYRGCDSCMWSLRIFRTEGRKKERKQGDMFKGDVNISLSLEIWIHESSS